MRYFSLIIIFYFSLGILILPMGDFSLTGEIVSMYRHCKLVEDKDMGPVDFVKDHLLNIDGLFDKHDNGDEQKPHSPIQFNHQHVTVNFISDSIVIMDPIANPNLLKTELLKLDYQYNFIARIFHPPIPFTIGVEQLLIQFLI